MTSPGPSAQEGSAEAALSPGASHTVTSGVLRKCLGLGLILVVAINVVNATFRYLFSWSLAGADELMVYLLIVVVMGSSVVLLRQRDHISVSLLVFRITVRQRTWLFRLHDFLALVVCSTVAFASWQFVQRLASLDIKSMSLGVPMWIPHVVVLVGLIGMSLAALLSLLGRARS